MNIHVADKIFQHQSAELITISQQFLLAAKTKQPTDSFTDILKKIPEDDIARQIKY